MDAVNVDSEFVSSVGIILVTVPLLINSDDETLTVADPKFTPRNRCFSGNVSCFDSVVVDINIDIPVFVIQKLVL